MSISLEEFGRECYNDNILCSNIKMERVCDQRKDSFRFDQFRSDAVERHLIRR